jgi:hypothetical protein
MHLQGKQQPKQHCCYHSSYASFAQWTMEEWVVDYATLSQSQVTVAQQRLP